jgi:hypothetical protein
MEREVVMTQQEETELKQAVRLVQNCIASKKCLTPTMMKQELMEAARSIGRIARGIKTND